MSELVDYYSLFRAPAYNSHHPKPAGAKNVVGQFDPMNCILYLDGDVSDALDASDGSPEFEVKDAGSPILLPFSTFLHEIIHWWQHVGTTSGLFYGLSIPTQALSTAKYLSEFGAELPKPLTHSVTNSLPSEHPALLSVLRWSELELGASLLFDPMTTSYTLRSRTRFYESLGHALLLTHISTMSAVASILDPGRRSLPDPDPWIDLYERFVKDERPCFAPREIIEFAIGLREIAEGQARVSEIQYRSLAYETMTWSEVKARGLLSGVYATAFEEFLRLTGFDEPSYPIDASVNLFLLLCDISLNPAEGYADDIADDGKFVYRVHPGIRFLKLCDLAKGNQGLLVGLKTLSAESYDVVAEALCGDAGWPTPRETGRRALFRLERMSNWQQLQAQREAGNYGSRDAPIRFYFAEHHAFLKTKVELPHLFCWPASFLTSKAESDPAEAEAVQEVLSWHMPPFLASSLESGVDSVHLSRMAPEQRSQFVSDYFATQVLYDLVRQWISKPGRFEFGYRWKPALSGEEQSILRQRFDTSLGIRLADIRPA